MEKSPYNIGLDIGTSSIGFAVTNDQGEIIRVKGRNAIGVRLFEEGHTAAERRGFRTTRRRLSRRKWRIHLLNQIFDPYISKVDPTFFARLKESNLSPKDDQKQFQGSLLFPDRQDYIFYRDFPTMYHLRQELMTEHRKFDIREIYLAMHHMIKYRGNFLNSASMSTFEAKKIDFREAFTNLNELYSEINPEEPFEFNLEQISDIEDILQSKEIYKQDKKKQIIKLLEVAGTNKAIKQRNKQIVTQFVNAILSYKVKLDKVLMVEEDGGNDWAIQLNDEEIDAKLEGLSTDLDENRIELIAVMCNLYNQLLLDEIVEEDTLSASMVKKYKAHKKHLKMLKTVITDSVDRTKAKALQSAYNAYVGKGEGKVTGKDEFYKTIQKNLDNSPLSKEIETLILLDQFMPKQRTSQNGVIPHQIHQKEMDRIIENQADFYPFLAELNPNEERRINAKYKLDELIAFRVPYYVGPLVTPEEQEKQTGASFAWMKRKEDGQITPWNFDEKVDRMESANRFIRRMTTKDTYLLAEDVLPAESLTYQRFKVLNELNNLRVNDRRLSIQDKQDIYNDLFKEVKTVTVKRIQNYLKCEKRSVAPVISGLAEDQFTSNLSTYIDFKKVFGQAIDDPQRQADFERIIEWSSIFEDRNIFEAKLRTLDWLDDEQIRQLLAKRYKGWGQLSAKLLNGIKNDEGNTILDELWNTQNNFMQIQAREDFAELIQQENAKVFQENDPKDIWSTIENVLNDAYTSPQNKKAIRQVIRVVQDIEKAMGEAPAKIAIEFTRARDRNPQRTSSRLARLALMYKEQAGKLSEQLLAEWQSVLEGKRTLTEKIYFYFLQCGQDMYATKVDDYQINIDNLKNYTIDHIMPQSFIKDDSLTNRALTHSKYNSIKDDRLPREAFGTQKVALWRRLADQGFISKKKFETLNMDKNAIDKYTRRGFVRRQLVETNQVIKLTANILGNMYQNQTEIIEVSSRLNSQMREILDLVKVREVNDYHHGFDAYLTIFIASYLYKKYPKLRPYFIYGEFKKSDSDLKWLKTFNFLSAFNQNKKNEIENRDAEEDSWTNSDRIEKIKKIYGYKYMLVSHETFTRSGALFNQTIYSRKNNDSKKLIPIKNDKPTDIYGGYSGNVDAYLAIVEIKDKKETKYKVVGIPMRAVNILKKAQSAGPERYLAKLHEVLEPQFTKIKRNRKTGMEEKKVIDFRIVVGKVNYRQMVQDGTTAFMLGSSTYKYNVKQLVLSERALKIIKNDNKYGDEVKDENSDLIEVYDEILENVNQRFDLYDKNGFRKRLNDNREKFVKLSVDDVYQGNKLEEYGKRHMISQILTGLHANAALGNLKPIGFSTPFGKMQDASGITLSTNAVLIHRSPSGIFERRIKLSDL